MNKIFTAGELVRHRASGEIGVIVDSAVKDSSCPSYGVSFGFGKGSAEFGTAMEKLDDSSEFYLASNSEQTNNEDLDSALEILITTSNIGKVTIREFLRRLLSDLWVQEKDFNSEKPFGRRYWQSTVIYALIRDGRIEGDLEKGDYNDKIADQYMARLINRLFETNGQW